jgi:tRNA-splicing ligase RtcB (3'-phosphate/5'-hydroxy nucleic acid ligase)
MTTAGLGLTRREAFVWELPRSGAMRVLCDAAHNTCRAEHLMAGKRRLLCIHRKGATRSQGPNHPDRPREFPSLGQPVLVGGNLGTASYILSGADSALDRTYASACHGAGRAMSRKRAVSRFRGRDVAYALAGQGVSLRAHDLKGVGEEAPGAYKDIEDVVQTTRALDLATLTARLRPLACSKG